MSTLERAIALAATVHSGQRDKAGAPYILHPLRMMMKMTTLEERMTAVLHDVVEDCGINMRLLAYEGFPPSVLESVEALTKRTREGIEESYSEFIQRAAQHPLAKVVKLADLEDNLDISRLANPTARDYARLEKYRAAREVILTAIIARN